MTTNSPIPVEQHLPYIVSETRDFGIQDRKGRPLGCGVRIWPVVYSPLPASPEAPRVSKQLFRISVFATRNGNQFGALGHVFDFPTEALARAGAEKKVAACRARYMKQFGPAKEGQL